MSVTIVGSLSRLFPPERLDLVPRLTLLLLLLTSAQTLPRLLLSAGLTLLVFRKPSIYGNGWFWIGLSLLMGIWNVTLWEDLDNHIWLANYWYLAVGLSMLSSEPERTLSTNARLLIGLTFAFAVLWKTMSPDYLPGNFFLYTLLTDIRLEYLSQGLAGLPDGAIAANRDSLALLEATSGARDEVGLTSAPALEVLADFMAWFGYLIEVGIALAFLLPLPPPTFWIRHALLVVFCVATYAVVPVGGFAGALLTMCAGMGETPRVRRLYATGFLVVVVYALAWQALVL